MKNHLILTVEKTVLNVKESVKRKSMLNNRLKIKKANLMSLDLIKMDMISMDSIIKAIIEMVSIVMDQLVIKRQHKNQMNLKP